MFAFIYKIFLNFGTGVGTGKKLEIMNRKR